MALFRLGLCWAEAAHVSRQTADCARMSSLQRVEKVLVRLVCPVSRHERLLRAGGRGERTGARAWAGRVVLGRGRVGHVVRVVTIMRAAGARVCAVVGLRRARGAIWPNPFSVVLVLPRSQTFANRL